ncbi:hypothetical protein [Streptomyces graminilatus]|uniref:hypothetical protein n=1 Tax=Streptomyces graminilatus TaxID=1464070 RepID=UPI0006E3532C|nr:hypothetical protein [Streptomyces graminilatus]
MTAKTPAQLADDAAEAIRALNHATMSTRPGWEFPADAYSVVGNLRELAQRLPQLYGQIGVFIQRLAADDHIRSDKGGDGADEVTAAYDALMRAQDDAVTMEAALDGAHSALSPLAYKE